MLESDHAPELVQTFLVLGNSNREGICKNWNKMNLSIATYKTGNKGEAFEIAWHKSIIKGRTKSKMVHFIWAEHRQTTSDQLEPYMFGKEQNPQLMGCS